MGREMGTGTGLGLGTHATALWTTALCSMKVWMSSTWNLLSSCKESDGMCLLGLFRDLPGPVWICCAGGRPAEKTQKMTV